MNLELQVVFRELITDIPKISQKNLVCSIYLNDGVKFMLLANVSLAGSFSVSDLTAKKSQRLQLRFSHLQTFLGSISIAVEDILSLSPMDFSQW